ncbi:MAG: preprotein translocase subunit SecA [Glaciecola sp.]|jgi:preprotein translocase subunit SecA
MIKSISKAITKIFGSKSDKDIKTILPLVKSIIAEQEKLKSLSHDELRAKTVEFKKFIKDFVSDEENKIEELQKKANDSALLVKEKTVIFKEIDEITASIQEKIEEALNEILPQAFATIRETSRRFKDNDFISVTANDNDRELATLKDYLEIKNDTAEFSTTWSAGGNDITWDMEQYQVQLIGGVVLHSGKIAEMATGEGKTLVATLPVYLNALAGKGVHLITVNDYLAKRDCEWMGPLFEFHGLSIDCIDNYEPNSDERRKAYNSDITYGTNSEFGFDYLRDNMASDVNLLVQRKHHYAIVDEVDSVLIDDARTPLIISGPSSRKQNLQYDELKPFVQELVQAQKTLVTKTLAEAKKLLAADDKENGGVELLRAFRGLPKNKPLIKFLSEQGTKLLLQKTENNYMQEQGKNMHIIDDELFFVIDEKTNAIELRDKGVALISKSISDKDFFVLEDIGAVFVALEKEGLAPKDEATKRNQITQDYSLKVERLHTMQQLIKAYTLFEKDDDYVVMDSAVKIVDEQTGRVMDGRRWSDGLHQAVEAKEGVKVEAITQTFASVTLQNYFRMYHKLSGMTGTAMTEAAELWDIYKLDVVEIPTNTPIVRDDRDDKVYKTQREKFNAVIEEINEVTKLGRPALVGTTSVEISELLSRALKMRGIKHNVLNAKRHEQEANIIKQAGQKAMVTIATNMAGRGTDIKLSGEIKAAGGLAIIATERHESRRVDRQLRGRAGRQGDPGSSQFFVSLDDNLMRLFGSERIAKLMDRMGLEEGEVIQHSMISKSIERAQRKVEENNFGMRKRLLEYDDVMNAQREGIYQKRRNALYGDRLSIDISTTLLSTIEAVIYKYHPSKDFDGFNDEMVTVFGMPCPLSVDEFSSYSDQTVYETITPLIIERFKEKRTNLAKITYPVAKDVFEKQGDQYVNMAVPMTDGVKVFDLSVNIQKAVESEGKEVVDRFERAITLMIIDDEWKEHLREMDDLRTNVQNASTEQKDPLQEFKKHSYIIFKDMLDKTNAEIVSFLMKGGVYSNSNNGSRKAAPRVVAEQVSQPAAITGSTNRGEALAQEKKAPKKAPAVAEAKVGRNEPCPCGSGKKFKSCHGKNS